MLSSFTKQVVLAIHSKHKDMDFFTFGEAVCDSVISITTAEIALAYRYYRELGGN